MFDQILAQQHLCAVGVDQVDEFTTVDRIDRRRVDNHHVGRRHRVGQGVVHLARVDALSDPPVAAQSAGAIGAVAALGSGRRQRCRSNRQAEIAIGGGNRRGGVHRKARSRAAAGRCVAQSGAGKIPRGRHRLELAIQHHGHAATIDLQTVDLLLVADHGRPARQDVSADALGRLDRGTRSTKHPGLVHKKVAGAGIGCGFALQRNQTTAAATGRGIGPQEGGAAGLGVDRRGITAHARRPLGDGLRAQAAQLLGLRNR